MVNLGSLLRRGYCLFGGVIHGNMVTIHLQQGEILIMLIRHRNHGQIHLARLLRVRLHSPKDLKESPHQVQPAHAERCDLPGSAGVKDQLPPKHSNRNMTL